MAKETGNAKSGEAGHVGHDRQPEKGATKGDVKGRSDEAAGMKQPKHARKDMVHPGPEREEAEKSKGL